MPTSSDEVHLPANVFNRKMPGQLRKSYVFQSVTLSAGQLNLSINRSLPQLNTLFDADEMTPGLGQMTYVKLLCVLYPYICI